MKRRQYLYTIVGFMVFFVALVFVRVHVSAVGLPKPSMAPPFVAPKAFRSPVEIMREKQQKLKEAIMHRKKRGLSVDPNRVRLVDPLYARAYKQERDYSKQPCYHMTGTTDPDEFVFCTSEQCTFPDGGYCEHKTRDCYDAQGDLILDEKGMSVTDNTALLRVDMCLEKDGSLVTPKGEKSFDEKITTGCGYRVRGATPYYKMYLKGQDGYMMTCDAARCLFHPGGIVYNRETKLFRTSQEETKTPPNEYYPYLDWTCLDGKRTNRVARKYRCSLVSEDKKNWGCEVCSENGKHVYKNCRYKYNEKGEIAGIRVPLSDALEAQLEELELAQDEFEQNPKTHHIVQAMSDIMMTLLRTPVSNAGQEKIVALFERFFDRRNDETWSVAQLGQELAVLRNKIRDAMKK